MPWKIATLLCALSVLASAIGLWRSRRQLTANRKERRELEGSLQILEEERHVLELIARGATLKEVLEALTQAVENTVPGVMCSVLLVDEKRQCLVLGAAPHLPSDYWKMCDGVPIIRDLGCCPSAASRNETVICEDMASDSRWAPIWGKISTFGLRSCWSEPIRDSETKRVIGTFAMYHGQPSKPTPFHLHAVQAGAHLAGNAIERLRAEQSLREYAERFSLAERAASFGIWEWEPVSQFFELSGGTALMCGFGPKAVRVTGEELYGNLHPDDHEPARLAREAAFAAGGSYEHEFRRIKPDGSIRWFHNKGNVLLQDGKPAKVIGAILEITEQKELLLNLERAKSAAETAARAKSDFLANMSHEIRTPMNAVMGMTNLILDQELPAETLEYVNVIRSSSDALLTIINDILDFSKIESGKLDLEREPLCLTECVEDVLELLAAKAAEKDIEVAANLDIQVGDWIYGDVTRLRQILLNLVGNAIKFTSHGEVIVSVGSGQTDRGVKTLHFAVRDTGIGIPADKINNLFQSFTQVDASTTRRFGGTGLGLAISKKLTELMGGKIWVTSQAGAGSVFQFEIPYEVAPAQKVDSIAPIDWQGKSILVVDDNEMNRVILHSYLDRWGLTCCIVKSAKEALEALRRQSWSALLLDWHMPEIDGVQLAFAIKEEFGGGAPPMIMLSSGTSSIKRAFGDAKNPFAAILSKPVRRQYLHRALTQVLSGVVQNQEIKAGKLFDESFARRFPLGILLAEDNAVNQTMAIRLLGKLGYRIDAVGNGLEVIQALQRQSYDLVLMDVQMPEMDGLEATQQIISMWGSKRPLITALTAGAMKENRDACLAAGVDDFLTKPMNIQQLEDSLQRCYWRIRTRLERHSCDQQILTPMNSETLDVVGA